jgi:protease-4
MNGDWIDDIEKEVSGMAKIRRDAEGIDPSDPARLSATADLLLADIASDWVRQKRRRRIGTWIFRIIVVGLLLLVALALLMQFFTRDPVSDEPYTATVSLKGAVFEEGEASADSLRKRLTDALEDELSAGVLLLIDSPGGSPVQAGLMYDDIQRLRKAHPDKPVHAVVGNMAASAGYYIASAADNIYANQASLIGSIGVRLDSFGAVDAIERLGLERRLLTAGEHKGLLDPFSPVDETGQEHLQSVLDSVHRQFIDAVKQGRGDRLSNDPDLFSGLVWNGEQAVALGLIDELKDRYAVARDVIGVEELRAFEPEQTLLEKLSDQLGAAVVESLRTRIEWR